MALESDLQSLFQLDPFARIPDLGSGWRRASGRSAHPGL